MKIELPRVAAYDEYERLLLRLHELNLADQLDSPEADIVREEMELPWRELSIAEQNRLAGLSHDTYSMSGEEIASNSQDGNQTALLEAAKDRYNHADWAGLLDALRDANQLVQSATLAYMRGRSWSALGRALPASLFFKHASELEPKNWHYRFLALDSLARTPRWADAVAEARTLIQAPDTAPQLLLCGAKVLFDVASSSQNQKHNLYEEVVAALRGSLQKIETTRASLPRSLVVAGRINLALALDRLGRRDEARRAYDEAVSNHPDSDEALLARALFLLDTEKDAAKRDLSVLVGRNTALSYPYFFLAHRALLDADYRDCVALCERGSRLAPPATIAANLLEWMAIAHQSLHADRDLVEFYFRAAKELDPLNERIRRNFELFLRSEPNEPSSQSVFSVEINVRPEEAARYLQTRLHPVAA